MAVIDRERQQSPDDPADRSSARVGRRTVLTVGAVAAALSTAACNPFSTTRVTRTEVVTAPPPIDPIDQLIAKTRLHYLRLVAAVQLGGATSTALTPLRDDRRQHLQALLDEQARTSRRTADPLTQAGQTVAPPSTASDAITMAVTDARDASTAFSDALGSVSRYRAMLFASIAASLA
ncbi:MAG: hypothetical protein INR72_15675, partial [Williamsia herbipolensis]|nr:hypothetical protein [Williamsia herbipolensis]